MPAVHRCVSLTPLAKTRNEQEEKSPSDRNRRGIFVLPPPVCCENLFFQHNCRLGGNFTCTAGANFTVLGQFHSPQANFTAFHRNAPPVCREIPFSLQKLSVSPAFAPLRQKKCFPAACFDKNPVFTLVQWCQEAYMAKTETRSRKWMFKIMNGRRDF